MQYFQKMIINASTAHFYESTGQEQPIDALHIACDFYWYWYRVRTAYYQSNVGIVLVWLDVIKQTLNG